MALKYREDPGLAVLALAGEEDLGRLADLLTYDETDGEKRVAQALLDEPAFNEARAAGALGRAWTLIAAELQVFGGDSVVNKFRGTGIHYAEILLDLAEHLGMKFGDAADVPARESALVHQLLVDRYLPGGEPTRSPPARAAAREFGCAELADGTLAADSLKARLADEADFFLVAIRVLRRLPRVNPKLSIMSRVTRVAAGGMLTVLSNKQSVTGPNFDVTLAAVLEVAHIRRKALRNPMNLAEI